MHRLDVLTLRSKEQSIVRPMYLVGTLDRWNNAKKAEERDRVKHSMNDQKGK